jgi:alpha-L-rhamnosidase
MLAIQHIRTENRPGSPVTDNPAPRFSFALQSDRQDVILAYVRAVVLLEGKEIWDSGKIKGGECRITYGGKKLSPFTAYEVRLEAGDNTGDSAEACASFSTGRLGLPWEAVWISDPGYLPEHKKSPVPMSFRRTVQLKSGLRRAFVNATAMGIFNLYLDKEKLGEDYFAPGFTSYGHQLQYETFDVTARLKKGGAHELKAIVAGGWAVGKFTYAGKTQLTADRQALLLELRIEYENGETELIATNEDWEVGIGGQYQFAEWYDGEICDATRSDADILWKQAAREHLKIYPGISARYSPPVRAHERMEAVLIGRSPSGECLYDFGQNFAGVLSATIQGKWGQKIVFRHAEVLSEEELFVRSLRSAKATATYICKEGLQIYSPQFTYMGFRYVGMTGADPQDITLSAYALYSDIETVGGFRCSDPLLNRLQQNIVWSGKSNFVDIPTDCPQRDERMGWTGDIAVFSPTAAFNFDTSAFLEKWLTDMRAEQGKDGGIPMVVPRQGDRWNPIVSSCWGDACLLVPWAEYMARGDAGVLMRQYKTMVRFLEGVRRWAAYMSIGKRARRIWKMPYHYGDWCAPEGDARLWKSRGKWIGTAYWANSLAIAAHAARLLQRVEEARAYDKLREEVCRAYLRTFTDKNGRLKHEFQTGYVLPLRFSMADKETAEKLAKNLVRLIEKTDYHLSTGFPGTPHLLFALSDYGYPDVAYKVLLQETCPSWLYEVKAGGTTIWERWDALLPDGTVNTGSADEKSGGMVSFNHYAMGAVGEWLYRRIAGLEPLSAGYRTLRIQPIVGGGITYAKAFTRGSNGDICAEWNLEGDVFTLKTVIPVGSRATIILPDGKRCQSGSGTYRYTCLLSFGNKEK